MKIKSYSKIRGKGALSQVFNILISVQHNNLKVLHSAHGLQALTCDFWCSNVHFLCFMVYKVKII